MNHLKVLAQKHHSFIEGDDPNFQRRARILQSIWREEQGYPATAYGDGLLGSSMPLPWARETGANFITETICAVVLDTLKPENRQKWQVIQTSRLFGNLLSSQPLCFNLFGELQQDLALASTVFAEVTGGRVDRVTDIKFEWAPGRADPKYTNDRSAFDVYVCYRTSNEGIGFIGIEVKYYEDLSGSISRNPRYDEIAELMGCFRSECRPQFCRPPLHQIWRDHLLAGIHCLEDSFKDGFFVFLYPQDNEKCTKAAGAYQECLLEDKTFAAWTMEAITAAIQRHTRDSWIDRFIDRYLFFEKLESPSPRRLFCE